MKRQAGVFLAMLAAAAGVWAQDAGRKLTFTLDRPGPPSLQYTISVAADGAGTYALRPADGTAAPAESKAIRVKPEMVKKLFAAVPMVEGGRCETHSKSIAQTGAKVLRFTGPGRVAECTYNYSDDDRVNEATDAFEGIAETMQFGERLRAKLRFDRLGLDTELDGLRGAVTEGRALEVGNIAPVLQTIVGDDRVMDRARRKAERLLDGVGQGQTAAGLGSSER